MPQNRSAPEVQGGSRSPIYNGYTYNEADAEEGDQQRQRRASNGKPWELVIYFVAYVALLFFAGNFIFGREDQRPEPKTLEERVDRILEDTPLIGT